MKILLSNSRKISSNILSPLHNAQLPLEQWSSVCQVGVFNRDGKLVSVSAIPVTV